MNWKDNLKYKLAQTGACVLTGVTIISAATLGLSFTSPKKNEVDQTKPTTGSYEVSIGRFNNDSFKILDVGDHNSVVTSFQDKKIKFCNENDISLGIIVSSSADNDEEIYNDVEYTKSILTKCKIDLPIYLGVDQIVENKSLNNAMKSKLINNFLEKCTSNHMYVGLYGKDTNLYFLKEYMGINKDNDYDAFIVMDQEQIRYNGTYSIYEDLNGVITKTADLSSLIETKDLNNPERFLNDGKYEIKENLDLLEIASKCGMSVNDLLKFNNLSANSIKEGTILRVPSTLGGATSDSSSYEYTELSTPIRGLDLSEYNTGIKSKGIDWERVKAVADFIILRSNYGNSEDQSFKSHAKNCSDYNIPIGVYCYNNWSKLNCSSDEILETNLKSQAEKTISLCNNQNIQWPVYLDIEAPTGKDLENMFTKEQMKTMLNIWYDKITEAGYVAGVYSNQSGFDYILECIGDDYKLSDKFSVWCAGGAQYTGGTKKYDINDIKPSSKILESTKYDATMCQSTDSGTNTGAETHNGYTDVNFSEIDYTNRTKTDDYKESEDDMFSIKEFDNLDRIDWKQLSVYGLGVIDIAGLGICSYNILKYKARKKRHSNTSEYTKRKTKR